MEVHIGGESKIKGMLYNKISEILVCQTQLFSTIFPVLSPPCCVQVYFFTFLSLLRHQSFEVLKSNRFDRKCLPTVNLTQKIFSD